MSLPLPAAVAAALVLAIGLALTATVASFPAGGRDAAVPALAPAGALAVQPGQSTVPETAIRSPLRTPPVV